MKNIKKILPFVLVSLVMFLPFVSFAATTCNANSENVGDVLCKVGSVLKLIIPLLIGLGMVYFIWGVVTYMISSEEEAKKAGKDKIVYGLIGFVVIGALWGLVTIVMKTFGFEQSTAIVSQFIDNNASLAGSDCELPANPKLGNLLGYATCFIYRSVIPLLVALAVVMFVWGVVQYVINSDEEAKKERGKQFMIWGIIGLTVMVGVWGLVKILGSTFGIEYVIPQLK